MGPRTLVLKMAVTVVSISRSVQGAWVASPALLMRMLSLGVRAEIVVKRFAIESGDVTSRAKVSIPRSARGVRVLVLRAVAKTR